MDERVFTIKIGEPIPAWDLRHRLPLTSAVGPECRDSGTIFRINSTSMDVSEQPHMMRQWLLTAVIFFGLLFLFFLFVVYRTPVEEWQFWTVFLASVLATGAMGCAWVIFKFGRDELLSLTRRPTRFNRVEKKIYPVRRRRFFFGQPAR